ncbi:MAG: patatin-like phospholipase family protein [Planctomycetes bacterium]|nr:patatin-like phospholipase family protein [Planctomycetota bacterium]
MFLHDDSLKQVFAGISLTLFLVAVFFVAYLLWLRDIRHGRLEPIFEDWLEKYPGGIKPPPTPQLYYGWYLLALVLSVLATVGAFLLILEVGGPLLRVLSGPADASPPEPGEDGGLAYLYLVAGIGVTLAALWRFGRHLGSLGDWLIRQFTPRTGPDRRAQWVKALGWFSGLLVLVGWGTATRLHFQGDFSFQDKGGTLVLTILGLLATTGALLLGWRSKAVPQWLFVLTCFANLILVYVFVSWGVSRCPLGLLVGLLLGVLCLVILLFALSAYCTGQWRHLRESLRKSLGHLSDEERAYRALGLGGVLVIAPFLLLVALVPAVASPIPLFMFLLFVVAVVYGVTAYFVRRRLIIVLILVVLLTFVSHIQPYGMRFEGLDFYSNDKLVNLRSAVNEDHDRQEAFNRLLDEYRDNEELLAATAGTLRGKKVEMDDPTTSKERQVMLARELSIVDDQKRRAEEERQRLTGKLKSSWGEMEKKNKVRAARFPSWLQQEYPVLASYLQVEDVPVLGTSTAGLLGAPFGQGPLLAASALIPGRIQEDREHRTRLLKTGQIKHKLGKGGEPEPLILIAVSGGGSRAAVWTFLVLKRLELEFAKKGIDFPSHVRMITGASGGMLGASYYVSTLPPPDQRPLDKPQFREAREEDLDQQQKRLGADFLTPLMKCLVFNDVPAWLSPWPARTDRGRGLEDAWNRHLLQPPFTPERADKPGPLEMTFADLRKGEQEGWRPSLVFTPMMIEDGRRLIISNLDLRWIVSNDGVVIPHAPERSDKTAKFTTNHSIEGLELFRLFPPALQTMKLSTAARMSASFPYFTPAISLPTVPRRRVVDAGYYDNYGVSLAAAWLFSEDNKQWIDEQSGRRILLIQIRDGITEHRRQMLDPKPDSSTYRSRSLEELTSPPEGLYNSQESSSSFRNDGQLELLFRTEELRDELRRMREDQTRRQEEVYRALKRNQDRITLALAEPKKAAELLKLLQEEQTTLLRSLEPQANTRPLPGKEGPTVKKRALKNRDPLNFPFVVANFELDPTTSLSWYLSTREKEKIKNAEKSLKDQIDTILKWFVMSDMSGELPLETPKE